MSLISSFLEAPRPIKRLISVVYDAIAISLSFYIAWALRLGSFELPIQAPDLICLGIIVLVSITTFIRLGLYRAILRYMAHQAAVSVLIGTIISSVTMAATSFLLDTSIPRSVPIIYVFTSLFFVAIPRMLIRNLVHFLSPRGGTKVLIYGAGRGGNQLAAVLQHSTEFHPIAFIDDDRKLHGSSVRGLAVLSPQQIGTIIEQHRVEKVLLALGNSPRNERLGIIRHLESYPIKVQTVPAVTDLINSRAHIEELRDIQIEDLLGRDPVSADSHLMSTNILGKVVMVTGAGGSIGSELARQIITQNPTTLVLFELNEYNLYKIEQELIQLIEQHKLIIKLVPLLGSVLNTKRLKSVMRSFGVETVYHAAAYKHVPLVEFNLIEGIQNNLFGTQSCAQAAIDSEVGTFVLISTDKAVRPTNIMGASKRLAELMLQGLSSEQSKTTFCIVRFGNVLGLLDL